MKKTIKLLLACGLLFAGNMVSNSAYAQVPQKFNYQGIARDTKGNPMANQQLALKLSVLPTADATEPEYVETQLITTNEFGLYTLQIGGGTVVVGDMKTVKWETGNKYIRVAIDPQGGTNYVDAGTTQLLSVPYAIYADKAGVARESVNAGGTTRATNNFVEKTSSTGVVNSTSQIYDNGSGVAIGGFTSPIYTLESRKNANTDWCIRTTNAAGTSRAAFRIQNEDSTLGQIDFTKFGKSYGGTFMGISRNNMAGINSLTGPFVLNCGGDMIFGNSLTVSPFTQTPRMTINGTTGNVGFGLPLGGAATARVEVNGQIKITGGAPGAGKVLTSDAAGLATWQTPSASGVTGSGTLNYIPKFTPSGTALGNSQLFDNGTNIGLGTAIPATKLDVNSTANSNYTTDGAVNIGTSSANHVTLDNNEIQAKSSLNTMNDLYLNDFGGTVHVANYNNHFYENGNATISNGLVTADNVNSVIGLGTSAPNPGYKTTITPSSLGGLVIEDAVGNISLNVSKSGANQAVIFSKTSTGTVTPTLEINSASPSAYSQENYTSGGGIAVYNYSSNPSYPNFYSYGTRNKGIEVYSDSNNAAYFSAGSLNYSTALYENGVIKAEYTGSASTDAPGVIGENTANLAWGIGVLGNGNFRGVVGNSPYTGVLGTTTGSGDGVYGYSNSTGNGVVGYSYKGIGVSGSSDSNSAGHFTAGNSVYSPALVNKGVLHGEYTGSAATSDYVGVYGKSIPNPAAFYGVGTKGEGGYIGLSGYGHNTGNIAYGVYGTAQGVGTSYGVYGYAYGTGTNWAGYMSGNHFISGTKNSAFLQADGKAVLVNCVETPGIWFEDMGSAEINGGVAIVDFPADLRAGVIIDASHKMIVNVTPTGDMGNYWVEKLNDKFILHAPTAANGTTFDWRMSAKRRGYEDYRLEYAGAAVANDKFIKDPYANKPNRDYNIAADNAAYAEEQRVHADVLNPQPSEDNSAKEVAASVRKTAEESQKRDAARKETKTQKSKQLTPAERAAMEKANTPKQEKAPAPKKEVSPNQSH